MGRNTYQPFKIDVSDEVLSDLRARLARTRWPDEIPDSQWQYGTNLRYLKELVDYWQHRFDWRKQEQELNSLAQYRVEIEGTVVHFIHELGRGPNPKPLLLLHGWPGSFCEFQQIIPMLTDPAAFGGDPKDSFSVVAPSLPGYGFSGRLPSRSMGIEAMASVMVKLMTDVLGYPRFAAQGGDWGAAVASCIGYAHTEKTTGVHLNMVGVAPAQGRDAPDVTQAEKDYIKQMGRWRHDEAGYQAIQGTKPQTLAYALNDSPAGLAAWLVEKFRSWSDCEGEVERRFTKDQLLTNVMVYWVTETINSSAVLYYEQRNRPWRLAPGTKVDAPTAVALFPKEIFRPPRSWAERAYNLKRWTEMPAGGHFAAMEEPAALAADIRAFLRDAH